MDRETARSLPTLHGVEPVISWCDVRQQRMRRAILLVVLCTAVAVSLLAIRATDRDRPGSVGAAATPATRSAPAQHPVDGTCRQIPLPVPPDRRVLV
jgi:hypothetical protein